MVLRGRALWSQPSSKKGLCNRPHCRQQTKILYKSAGSQETTSRMRGISILQVLKSIHDCAGLMEGTGPKEKRQESPRSARGSQGHSLSPLGLPWDVCSCCPCPREKRGLSLWDCQSGTFHQS